MVEAIAPLLADVSRLMRRSFDARARDIGITRPQWQVLVTLRRNEGVNQGGLADLLDVEPITVCRMVDRLQEASLVERRPDPADRRSWMLFLTPKADELIEQLRPLALDLFEQAFGGLGDEERTALATSLERMRQNLSRKPVTAMVSNG